MTHCLQQVSTNSRSVQRLTSLLVDPSLTSPDVSAKIGEICGSIFEVLYFGVRVVEETARGESADFTDLNDYKRPGEIGLVVLIEEREERRNVRSSAAIQRKIHVESGGL